MDKAPAASPVETTGNPCVLIVDDSRIVRASLIKHIEGKFAFREASDGEAAWEILLTSPAIRIVITDLTMPKLDGYGLLQRIRNSKISRIRDIPVVVISGSDEREERERAKALGATDLISKGIDSAPLLSRLAILSKLNNTRQEFERNLESMADKRKPGGSLATMATLESQADIFLQSALREARNFVILNVCIGLKHIGLEGAVAVAPGNVVNAVGLLLQSTVRQADIAAKSGDAEFTLATGSIQFDKARNFAQRICGAVASVNAGQQEGMLIVASCGMVALSEYAPEAPPATLTLAALRDIAHQRASLGLHHAVSGVVGAEEEAAFRLGMAPLTDEMMMQLSDPDAVAEAKPPTVAPASAHPDLVTLLGWIKEGKQEQVLQHMDTLSEELLPLIDFMLQQAKH